MSLNQFAPAPIAAPPPSSSSPQFQAVRVVGVRGASSTNRDLPQLVARYDLRALRLWRLEFAAIVSAGAVLGVVINAL